jgi:transcriptional regulator with XRE-family HTH domain
LRVVELRSGDGLSREAFAERLDVSLRYVARLEAGVRILRFIESRGSRAICECV